MDILNKFDKGKVTIGYKGFDKNLQCKDFQYEMGKLYEVEEPSEPFERGFRFYKTLADCVHFYDPEEGCRYCEVIALGEVVSHKILIGNIHATNSIYIARELSAEEVRYLLNIGHSNIGEGNCGSDNVGNGNHGWNNIGDNNIGSCNRGDKNLGDTNQGSYNFGDSNIGDKNCGYSNRGNFNWGKNNIGDYNCGKSNKGNYNIGSLNKGDNCIGVFNSDGAEVYAFDKPSGLTLRQWRMDYGNLLDEFILDDSEYNSAAWGTLSEARKKRIFSLPNFNIDIFQSFLGIDVTEEYNIYLAQQSERYKE